ncbi:MAG: hypothetical protein ABSH53_01830 [Holophaga sp.]
MMLPILATLPLAGAAPLGSWSVASAPDLQAVIDQATAPMNFLTRPIARSRLRNTNVVFRRIQVARTGAEVTITFDDRQPMSMPLDGTPVAWTREDGEKMTVAARLDGDDLEQTFTAHDGQRVNHFHVDPDTRTLRFQVTVRSGRLPGPVAYTVDYRPAPTSE